MCCALLYNSNDLKNLAPTEFIRFRDHMGLINISERINYGQTGEKGLQYEDLFDDSTWNLTTTTPNERLSDTQNLESLLFLPFFLRGFLEA